MHKLVYCDASVEQIYLPNVKYIELVSVL